MKFADCVEGEDVLVVDADLEDVFEEKHGFGDGEGVEAEVFDEAVLVEDGRVF